MVFKNRKPEINRFIRRHRYHGIAFLLLGVVLASIFEIWTYLNPTGDGRLSMTSPQQTEQSSAGRQWREQDNMIEERFKPLKTSRMLDAMKRAAQEFDVPLDLLIGIASAESSLGTSFQFHYDHNCNNWWGIRKVRDDGSYLRCFLNEKAGARTAAKLLRNHYLDEGYTSIEDICRKWIGNKASEMKCSSWVRNVRQYAYNNE